MTVSRETEDRLAHFKAMVIDENQRQNLISPASVDEFDTRHIADAVQLAELGKAGTWCDVGSGAGLPGVVIAMITGAPMTLIEPRRLRADFLRRAVSELQINAEVCEMKANGCRPISTISLRALWQNCQAVRNHRASGPARDAVDPSKRQKRAEGTGSGAAVVARCVHAGAEPTSDAAMILVGEGVRRRGKR
jgi:16S rRNA (guanine527-N7)-methyltransferase